ncbi:hypothetical protein D3C78_1554970 [compost metagenome]
MIGGDKPRRGISPGFGRLAQVEGRFLRYPIRETDPEHRKPAFQVHRILTLQVGGMGTLRIEDDLGLPGDAPDNR